MKGKRESRVLSAIGYESISEVLPNPDLGPRGDQN